MSIPSTLPLPTPTPGKSKLEESDEDMFTVPDVEGREEETKERIKRSKGNHNFESCNYNSNDNNCDPLPLKRRRGRNPVDKEYRRLKRVSAQQARERKKVYVNDLEGRAIDLQDKNFQLEERISTLINENTMLRKILMNTRPKADDSEEPKRA